VGFPALRLLRHAWAIANVIFFIGVVIIDGLGASHLVFKLMSVWGILHYPFLRAAELVLPKGEIGNVLYGFMSIVIAIGLASVCWFFVVYFSIYGKHAAGHAPDASSPR